tara:strand:- start:920 stop:2203 length:1284 start_codon:yes stop_codon:yes gene_type:complete
MYKYIKSNQSLIILTSLIVISYALGFYLNEDSAGGGKVDYIGHEWGTIQLFVNNKLNIALNSALYESSRTPLFYIINTFIPFDYDIESLRLFWFIFSITIPILFYYTLKLTISERLNKIHIALFAFILFISPYFRTNAYWPSSENLQIFFVILSLFFYFLLINKNKNEKFKLYSFSSLSIFFAYCAFYTDQKAFFLVALIYFDLVRRNNFFFFLMFSFINLIFFLPTIYLFISWGGLVPFESQFRVSKYTQGTNIFISTIGIYFALIFISNFLRINLWEKINFKQFELILIFALAVFLLFTLPAEPITFGSGIISKLLGIISIKLSFNWNIIKYVYFIINLLFIGIIFLIVKQTLRNLIIFSSFLLVYNLTYVTYQSYVDPIFYILILTILDFKKNIVIFNKKTCYLFLCFYSFMLSGSIIMRNYII